MKRGRPNKYPFNTLDVGETFDFSRVDNETNNIRSAACQYGKRNGIMFSINVLDGVTGRCTRMA